MVDRPREQAKFWRAPEFENLELLHATFITHAYDRHFHEEYVVGVLVRGAYEFYYRRTQHRAQAGHIILVNPGEIHDGAPVFDGGYTYRTLYPSVHLMQHIACEIGGEHWGLPFFPEPLVADPDLFQTLVRMHHTLENSTSRLERDTAIRAALGALLIRHADFRLKPMIWRGDEPGTIKRVRGYLDAHYAENPSLEQLASLAGLSPYHLVRVFRQETGLPPHSYLTQVRIEHARRQLQAGAPIADVAAATGFSDQSHLTRRFKRIVGVTPGQFVQNL